MPKLEAIFQKTATRRRKLFNGRIECTYFQYLGPRPPKGYFDDDYVEPVESSTSSNESGNALAGSDGILPDQNAPGIEQGRTGTSQEDAPLRKKPAASALPLNDEVDSTKAGQGTSVWEAAKAKRAARNTQTKPDVAPIFGGLEAKDHEQAELFRSRLVKRARHLRRWPTKRGITCFRLYERDIPEIPLVVDRYQDNLHITEYERPHERDRGRHAAWLELMRTTAADALDVDPEQSHLSLIHI